MANYTSGAAAYQQLKPIEDKTLENLYKLDQVIAEREKRRMAKQKMDADARAKKENALRKSIKDSGALDPIEMPISKVSDLNQINFMAVDDATRKVKGIVDLMAKGQINEYDANFKINNFKQIPRKIQAGQQKFEQEYLRAEELEASGKMSSWDRDRFDQMKAFVVQEDPETGQPVYNFRYSVDNNGKLYAIGKTPKGEVGFSSVDDFLAGRSDLFNFTPEADYDVTVSDTVKDLGKVKLTGLEGPYKVQEQTFETVNPDTGYSNKDVTTGKADILFGNEDAPTPLAKRYWSDILNREPSELDEEGVQGMKDNFVKDVGAKYGFERSKLLDSTYESRRKSIEDKKNEEGVDQPFIEIDKAVSGKPIKEIIPGISGRRVQGIPIGEPGFVFSAPKTPKIKYEGEEYQAEKFFLTESGKPAVIATKIKVIPSEFEGQKPTKEIEKVAIGGEGTGDVKLFTNIIRQLPKDPATGKKFKDVPEFTKHLQNLAGMEGEEAVVEEKVKEDVKEENKETKKLTGKGFTKKDIKKMMEAYGKTEKEISDYLLENGGKLI